MHLAIHGICGKMGKTVLQLAQTEKKIQSIIGIDNKIEDLQLPIYANLKELSQKIDVIIDFSTPTALDTLLSYAIDTKAPIVLATTGYTAVEQQKIEKAAQQIAIFQSANFSMGMHIFSLLAQKATELLGESFDIEIIEKHHNEKKDAPSGTAFMLANTLQQARPQLQCNTTRYATKVARAKNEIGIHAVRGGNIIGEHQVLFCGNDELLTFTHSATSKKIFAQGALQAAFFIQNKSARLYGMQDMLTQTLCL